MALKMIFELYFCIDAILEAQAIPLFALCVVLLAYFMAYLPIFGTFGQNHCQKHLMLHLQTASRGGHTLVGFQVDNLVSGVIWLIYCGTHFKVEFEFSYLAFCAKKFTCIGLPCS